MAFDGPLIAGRYRLGPRLGHGSQGEIFLARDEKAKGLDGKVRDHRQMVGAEPAARPRRDRAEAGPETDSLSYNRGAEQDSRLRRFLVVIRSV